MNILMEVVFRFSAQLTEKDIRMCLQTERGENLTTSRFTSEEMEEYIKDENRVSTAKGS